MSEIRCEDCRQTNQKHYEENVLWRPWQRAYLCLHCWLERRAAVRKGDPREA